ncbi:MAG TPA: radical SAM protein, partial [Gemmatales bacterium]|nr:radical SAM protein [Gemmatales bacterium]
MQRRFRPDYISFAGTYQCNLSCPHCCVPIEWTERLPISVALRFLEEAYAYGIRRIGFTGGEPFVYPEFVIAVARRAAELGFRFDKIMSNGVWFQEETDLVNVFTELHRAGFTGKLGMTVDKFHGTDIDKMATFCLAARRVFARDNIVSLSYASRAPDQGLELIRKLAQKLEGVLDYSEVLQRYLVVTPDLTMTLN